MHFKPRRLMIALVLCAVPLAIEVAGLRPTARTCDGVGPTLIRSTGVSISPGYSQRVLPGEHAVYTHAVTNTGTVSDTYWLDASSGQDWQGMLFDAEHLPTHSLPVTLAAGRATTISLSVTAPRNVLSGTVGHTIITATSLTSETVTATAADATVVYRIPSLALSAGQSREGTPGSLITFTHWITNTGPITDILNVEAVSQQGWSVDVREPQNTGLSFLPLELGELQSAEFVVSIEIPTAAAADSADRINVTATSLVSSSVMTRITDTVVVLSDAVDTVFLPVTQSQGPPLVSLGVDFGYMVTDPDVVDHDFPLTQAMGVDWMRVFLRWRAVEASPGEYDWAHYDPVFNQIKQLGMKAIVVVHAAPDWVAEQSCGPISDTIALETFLEHLVPRYAEATEVWEFINEPDGKAPQPQYPKGVMGCWGPYPAEYARQLSIFHAQVRSLDPDALVAFGGLAYDAWDRFERSFFTRTLEAGAGPFFDVANVHYYPINADEFPTMAHKVNEIHDTMMRNGVYGKRIWVTETGMWVNHWGSVERQRDFIVQEFTRGFGAGVDNVFWFDPREHYVGEGVHRWLISEDHEPIYGYDTFQHYAGKLEGLHCEGTYQEVPESVEAYRFSGGQRSVYILWSETTTQTVTIPASVDALLTDRDGKTTEKVPAQNGEVSFSVGNEPLFLELVEGFRLDE